MATDETSDKVCKSCGSSEFETDNGYKICMSCGDVDSCGEQQLVSCPMSIIPNSQLFSNQTVHNSLRNELLAELKTTSAQQLGLKMAETLAVNYCFNSEMNNYLMNYYRKALNHKNFLRFSVHNKRILSAVCAYITLMNHNESIAIQHICSAVDCNGFDFGQIYNLFIATFPETKPMSKPIEELVPAVLADFNVDQQEFNRLRDRVIDIICLEKSCWLIEGRSPFHLIVAATYLGWKSLEPYSRCSVNFRVFCAKFGIPYKRTSLSRVKELNNTFIKLAQLIPGVKQRKIAINRRNVTVYIKDIICYQNSLIYDLKSSFYPTIDQTSGQSKEEDIQKDWMNTFRKKRESSGSIKRCESESGYSQKKLKLDDEEDDGISDTEIDSYIRTEKEVQMIKMLRKSAKKLNKQFAK